MTQKLNFKWCWSVTPWNLNATQVQNGVRVLQPAGTLALNKTRFTRLYLNISNIFRKVPHLFSSCLFTFFFCSLCSNCSRGCSPTDAESVYHRRHRNALISAVSSPWLMFVIFTGAQERPLSVLNRDASLAKHYHLAYLLSALTVTSQQLTALTCVQGDFVVWILWTVIFCPFFPVPPPVLILDKQSPHYRCVTLSGNKSMK